MSINVFNDSHTAWLCTPSLLLMDRSISNNRLMQLWSILIRQSPNRIIHLVNKIPIGLAADWRGIEVFVVRHRNHIEALRDLWRKESSYWSSKDDLKALRNYQLAKEFSESEIPSWWSIVEKWSSVQNRQWLEVLRAIEVFLEERDEISPLFNLQ